jgi:hypothetical protein
MQTLNLKFKLISIAIAVVFLLSISATACSVDDKSGVTLEETNNRVASAAVHVAAVGLSEILKKCNDEGQRVKTIQDFIDPIRFF